EKQRLLNVFMVQTTCLSTMVTWGTAGGMALIHFTDWRLILDFVPYVKEKFKKDEEIKMTRPAVGFLSAQVGCPVSAG
uniref:Uncharacterized protein n=1 Tax=Cyprinodon variegatus TaxID=28743 RepID=A0A3Q2D837_CYPVA